MQFINFILDFFLISIKRKTSWLWFVALTQNKLQRNWHEKLPNCEQLGPQKERKVIGRTSKPGTSIRLKRRSTEPNPAPHIHDPWSPNEQFKLAGVCRSAISNPADQACKSEESRPSLRTVPKRWHNTAEAQADGDFAAQNQLHLEEKD